MIEYIEIHHASVLVRDTAQALSFYHHVLGMTLHPARPDLGYPGAWLQIGRQQIHLLELPNPDLKTERPEHGGRDRHIALMVKDLDPLKRALDENHIPYRLSHSGRQALFCRDPDNNTLEFIEQP